MIARFLNNQSKTITSAAFILGISAFLSRLLGLFRDRLLASRFGAGDELDMYYTAFRIPDFIFHILIIGAISAAFVPVFTEYWSRDQKEAWRLVNGTLNIFLFTMGFILMILFFLCPFIMPLIAPGFFGEKREMTIALTRIMLFSPLILTVSNIFSGVLQSFYRFFVYSLTPIMYNLGIIFGILFFVPNFGVLGLAWGVVLGAILHLIIQIPAVWLTGFRYKLIFNIAHQGIRKIIKLMMPRTIGIAGSQLNLIVITAIASTLVSGSIAVFNLSNNLQYFPIGIIGISFATAAFPFLSQDSGFGFFDKKHLNNFIKKFSSTFRQILFLIIPLSCLFFLLRAQIVRVILGTGHFGWVDTRLTAACLGLFSFGIFAYCLIPLIAKAFYALQDTKTPTLISLFCLALNIGLSFLFVWSLKFTNFFQMLLTKILDIQDISQVAVLGLPLALSLTGILNFVLLLIFLYKKIGNFDLKEIFNSFLKILIATFLMGLGTILSLQILSEFVNMETFLGVFSQAVLSGLVGISIYILVAHFLKSPEQKRIWFLISRRQREAPI